MENIPTKVQLIQFLRKLPSQDVKEIIAAVSIDDKPDAETSALDHVADDRFLNGVFCPHCGETESYVRFGFSRGKQRYRCGGCGRTFMATTNSIFAFTKRPIELWQRYMECMAQGMSIRKAATACGISVMSSFVWRHKILDSLARTFDRTGPNLKGIVEADETFFPLSFKGRKPESFEYPQDRLPRKRGGGNHIRGLSKDLVCVPCAVDRERIIVSKAASLGVPSVADVKKVLAGKIDKQSTLCTDACKVYPSFAAAEGIRLVSLPKGIRRIGVYHIQHANAYHSRLKDFIRPFKGVATKYLDNYLTWNNSMKEQGLKAEVAVRTIFKESVRSEKHVRRSDILTRPAIPFLSGGQFESLINTLGE
jgi:transposase-like protein